MTEAAQSYSLTVLLPTKREAGNLPTIIERLHAALDDKVSKLEILIVDTPSDDGTEEIAKKYNARYISAVDGYANAIRTGFAAIETDLALTMDADCSHDPAFIPFLLREIDNCDLVIASRYEQQGGQETTLFRYFTSRVLNWWLSFVCSMPIKDLSGGFKLYRREVLQELELVSSGFEVQCEINICAYGHGFRLREIGFVYHPRMEGRSKAAIVKFGMAFLMTSLRLRQQRNSRHHCDYDERAFNSRIPMQRIWQRQRYEQLMALQPPEGKCLDVGCGSGRLIVGHPRVVGVDINFINLRYLARHPRSLAQADAAKLPFRSDSFDHVYCCEVIEHLEDDAIFAELARITKPGGRVLISTPDYGRAIWPTLEGIYNTLVHSAKGHEHLTRYDAAKLKASGENVGLKLKREARVFGAIVYMQFERPAGA